LSSTTSSEPTGAPGLVIGIGYSVTLPVFGSSTPSMCVPKSPYQIIPFASATASCGSVSGRGRSYSVMMTRVDLPEGRGYVLSG
jgi:hypothetical protein